MRIQQMLALTLGFVFALSVLPAAADHPVWAKPRDLRVLQDELVSLDATLAQLEQKRSHAQYAEFSDRAESLRRDVTAMRAQVRADERGEGVGVPLTDVQRIRTEIADLRTDIESALDLRYTGGRAALPRDTAVLIRLDQSVSSRTARAEDRLTATVAEPVLLDGRVVIPVGTEVQGFVRTAESAERLSRGGKLELVFDRVRLGNETFEMRTRLVEVKEGIDKSQAGQKAGLGALLGGVLGGIVEGTQGAIIGAILGAGGGVAASKGEDVVLPEGTLLTLRTDDTVYVGR